MSAVNNLADAEKFIVDYPELKAKIIRIIPETALYKGYDDLKYSKDAKVYSVDGDYFRVFSSTPQIAYKVSYIYLDGSKMSLDEINRTREKIRSEFRNGRSFADLANVYTMDNNPNGGDLNWFDEKQMVPEFVSAVKSHQKGDVYTVDIPDRKWYYVVLKTHEDRNVEALEILRVKKKE